MAKKQLNLEQISSFRYLITKPPNEIWQLPAGLGMTQLKMALTYAQLIAKHVSQLRLTGAASSLQQVERNHLTALRAFLRTFQLHETSPVGPELTTDFDAQLKHHLNTSGLADKSKADRKSLMNGWRATFLALGETPEMRTSRERRHAASSPLERNPFEKALWDALKAANIAPKTAAIRAGICTSAIGRWTRGAIPNVRTTASFARLESVLNMAPGALMSAFNQATGNGEGSTQNEFRARLKERTADKYLLKASESLPALVQEWRSFFRFKTARSSGTLVRGKKAVWGLADINKSTVKPTAFNSKGSEISTTAEMVWQQLSKFFGFLMRPEDKDGYGLEPEVAQSMAWLAVPEAVDAFMHFMKRRSDGIVHGGHRTVAMTIMSLTHSLNGYLTQTPALALKLPDSCLLDRTWTQLCKETWETASSWKADAKGKSREPSEPIQFLLDMKEPAVPIFAAMQRLRRVGNGEIANSKREAIARRDELLIGLLLSNPLRGKNLKLMTYKENNTGNIHKDSNGLWRIRISGVDFKNSSRVGNDKYNVPVASWLQKLVDDYVKVHRPTLMGAGSNDCFFLTKSGGRFKTLDKQVFDLTKRHIPGCSGFSPHAFRHLIATDWLTKNPNDFLTVAELLNDTIEVVMSNYAHLKKDVAFGRYEAYVQVMRPCGM